MSKAINVTATNATAPHLPRNEMLAWVNLSLQAQFSKIDELCTGAAYCQFMDLLFPGSVNLQRVRYKTNVEYEFIENFKVLQAAFKKVSVERTVPIEKLIKGRFQDNLEFLQWFKKFFDANDSGREYDASAVRQGAPMGYGAGEGKAGKARRAPAARAAQEASAGSPIVTKVLSRSNTTVQEKESCRESPEADLELREISDKPVEICVSLSPEQNRPGCAVVKPQREEPVATPEEPPTELLGSPDTSTDSHQMGAVDIGDNNNSRDPKDSTGTGSPQAEQGNWMELDRCQLERRVELMKLQKTFYFEKCLKLEALCYEPEGVTENQKILDILYATQDRFYPPAELQDNFQIGLFPAELNYIDICHSEC